MVTGELKSKIDSPWEIFRTGGLTNPLDVIEQMTCGFCYRQTSISKD